jgi:citrate lyase subunit beta/citryl-CoA lyase
MPADVRGPALLFCPGDRPERFDKALAAADSVILDLEDAVGPEHKDVAWTHVIEALAVLTRDVVDGHAASRVIGGRPPRAEWARRVL